jgi:hypothetical protein
VSYFHEEQRFARSWAWLLVVIFILGAVGLALGLTASPRMTPLATGVAAITVLAVLAVLSIARLETASTQTRWSSPSVGSGRRGA